MKLRFKVNQAECLKRGIDAPKSIVTVEVNPKELPQKDRDLIAKHMDGIDVCKLGSDGKPLLYPHPELDKFVPDYIMADGLTIEDLLRAIKTESQSDDPVQRVRAATL